MKYRLKISCFLYFIPFYQISMKGRYCTMDYIETIPVPLVKFSDALAEQAKSIPVQSLILFFSLPLHFFLSLGPVESYLLNLKTWSSNLSFRFLAMAKCSLNSPIASWIFLQTSSLVTWSFYEMFYSLR